MILRLLYTKNGFIRFNAHLDMVRIFERSLRRAGVELAFSQGFNPHPKMSFASPLSVGVASDYEIIDIEVVSEPNIEDFIKKSSDYFPEGLVITAGKILEKSRAPMSMISRAQYISTFKTDKSVTVSNEIIESFLKNDNIDYYRISKKGKSKEPKLINIRPYIFSLKKSSESQDNSLEMIIAQGSEFNLKPEAVTEKLAEFMGCEITEGTIRLKRTFMWGDDSSGNPVELYDLV